MSNLSFLEKVQAWLFSLSFKIMWKTKYFIASGYKLAF